MEAIYVGYVAAGVYVLLPFIYGITAPDWRKTQPGRSFMMMLASLAAVFLLVTTASLFGQYQGRELIRLVVYGALLAAGVRLAVLFLQLRYGKNQVEWQLKDDDRRAARAEKQQRDRA